MSLPRIPLLALVAAASFGLGMAAHRIEGSARAQSAPFASTVYVPSDGLAFRAFDGRIVARLSYDRRGGVFEVYDGDERPSAGVRADALHQGDPAERPSNPLDMRIK